MARVISAVLTLKDKNFSANAKRATSALTDTQRQAKHAQNTVKGFGKSVSSGFKNVATSAAGMAGAIGITTALSGAINMVKGSLDTAFGRIDTMEQFDRTMTELTGSAESAQSALDATNEVVKGTAYGLDTAAKSVQDFVTRGLDVETATERVAAWGDAVAFYGDGSNEQLSAVSDALAKMSTKGTVEMDQLNRLFDVGIDAVGMYAQATGSSSSEVQDALSAGEISSEQFIDTVTKAMTEGTNGVTKVAGAAKEAGASWSGSFANMRAAVARGVTNVIESIDEMLTSNGLPDMRGMVANLGETFETVLSNAGDQVPVVTGYLVGMYEKAKPGIDWMKDTAFPAVRDAIGFVVDRATDLYNFITNNWSLISPIIAGVTATILTFRAGIVAVTAAKATWQAVTSGVQIATALLNGTLAISPLGWVALAIGGVVAAGVLLWKNWDTVKAAAQSLWDKMVDVGEGIKGAWESAWGSVKSAAETAVNGVIGMINNLIETINKIPGVDVPIVAKVDWTDAEPPANGTVVSASYAVGTNRVPRDMVARIHKDEMIIPARQSDELRKQGISIDNIDQMAKPTIPSIRQSQSNSDADLKTLIELLKRFLSQYQQGDTIIKVDARDKSVTEIMNELIPLLKRRLANM